MTLTVFDHVPVGPTTAKNLFAGETEPILARVAAPVLATVGGKARRMMASHGVLAYVLTHMRAAPEVYS
jgi:hypothetical protein